MNLWHDLSKERINEDDFIAVIEISKGSKKKYELDKETGGIILDRILHTSTIYPTSYGFIPLTYEKDDDPLDVLVLCTEPLDPKVLVRCYPIGIVDMKDDGESDQKVIAIPFADPVYEEYKDIKDLPKHTFDEIRHFFTVYKQLEKGNKTIVETVYGAKEAKKAIKISINNYKEKFKKISKDV